MLRKLMQYEFTATGRIFLPLYGALIVVAFIQRLFLNFNIGNMENLSLGILASTGNIDSGRLDDFIIAGELSLSGELRAICGGVSLALLARAKKCAA